MNLIFLAYSYGNAVVSQGCEILKYINTKNKFDKIYVVIGYRNQEEIEKYSMILNKYPVELIWYKVYPNYLFFYPKIINNIYNVLKQIITQDTIIHARGEICGSFSKILENKFKYKVKTLIDLRGAGYEEISLYTNNLIVKKIKLIGLKKAYKKIIDIPHSEINVVSEAAKKYFCERFQMKHEKICVNNCVAGDNFIYSENDRNIIRDKYKIASSQKVAVCSTGGNSAWQKDSLVIDRLLDNGFIVFNLSKLKYEKAGVINLYLPYDEVPKILSAADVAILYREDNLVNNTASPIKFSEFAVMGLYVIHNGTVEVVNKYINDTNAGYIIKQISDIDNITYPIFNLERRKWIKEGLNHYSIKAIGDGYMKKYNQM